MMMDKDSILTELAKNRVLEEMIDNMGVKEMYKDDLLQETFLILLEYDEDKIIHLYNSGELRFFCSRILTNQYNSKTSRFYYKYKRYNTKKSDGEQPKPEPERTEGDDD